MSDGRKEPTYIFVNVCDPSHAQDGDPDGTDRPQEVTVLQGVVVHYTQHSYTRLVTCVVELQKEKRPLQSSQAGQARVTGSDT